MPRWNPVETAAVATLGMLALLGLLLGVTPAVGTLWNNAGLGILTAAVISAVVASMEIQSRHRDTERAKSEKERDDRLLTTLRDIDQRRAEGYNRQLTRAICQLSLALGGTFKGFQGQKMDLQGLRFTEMDLTDADLTEADVSDADFRNCHLVDASFVQLKSADGARFDGSRFLRVDFSGANLVGAHWDGVVFTECTFSNARMDDPATSGAKFRDCEGLAEEGSAI